ncbi:AAA family ATPase [Oxalobacteraceae bacterium OM1]|nr:AAA family ATPase [Oxalobacteraceae bacterium OM1]
MGQEEMRRAVAEISGTIVMHPLFEKAYNGVLKIVETSSMIDMPFGATVTAPPGCGKTALIRAISRAIPSTELLGDDIRSISIAAEANASQGHFVSKLLKALGYPSVIRASTLYDQTSIIIEALRDRCVKVLFLDEFQHVCRGNRTLSAAGILDWVKQLSDAAGIVVVMLGTRELKPLCEMNDQLGSRAPASFTLKEFERNSEWVGLLRRLSDGVTSIDLSPISTEFYKPLHASSNGVLRHLKQILVMSTIAAMESGKTKIDRASFTIGHARVYGDKPSSPNPFAL